MSEYYKIAMALQKERENEEALREAAIVQEEKNRLSDYERISYIREAHQRKMDNIAKYQSDVKRYLLHEALTKLVIGSIKSPTDREKTICESLVGNYIKERGVEEILEGFDQSSPFLTDMKNIIDKHYHIMTEGVDEDPEEHPEEIKLDREHIDDFFEELDNEDDVEDVTNTIRIRVASAEEEFVNRNEEDKRNLESIIKDTAQRVQDAKPSLDNNYDDELSEDEDEDDTEPSIGEDGEEPKDDSEEGDVTPAIEAARYRRESMLEAKRAIAEYNSRPRNVFSRMVLNTADAVMKDPVLKEQYSLQNGRLDIDSVVEAARCMYTFLETVSTLRIEKVDAQYVEDTINSINS